jgi:hypothetical protein
MERQSIEERLARILEQLRQSGKPSVGSAEEIDPLREISMKLSVQKEEDCNPSTAFSDHSDWSDSW